MYRLAILLFVLLCTPLVLAQEGPATHPITIEDYFTLSYPGNCIVSPDGKWVVYTRSSWQEGKETRNTDLWLIGPRGYERRLTFDAAADYAPQWSHDSKQIFFLSARKRGDEEAPFNGKTQVWSLTIPKAESTSPVEVPRIIPITRLEESVKAFAISDDTNPLYYSVDVDLDPKKWRDLRKRYPDLEYGSGKRTVSEIYQLDLLTWRTKRLVTPGDNIFEFSVSPDGSKIALITVPDSRLVSYEGLSKVEIYDVATGRLQPLPDQLWRDDAPSPFGWIEGLAWARDSNRLAWRVLWDGYPGEIFAGEVASLEPRVWKIRRPNGWTIYAGKLQWHNGGLCFLAEDHARQRLVRVKQVADGGQGEAEVLTPGDVVVSDYSFARDVATLVAIRADPTHGQEIHVVEAGSSGFEPGQVSSINPQIRTWQLPQLKVVRWQGANGDTVDGILELPPNYQEGDEPLPMMVHIHGGPTSASTYSFTYQWDGRTYFAAQGYAVLSPNYRGSTGYGDRFMTELIGHENDIEVKDILAGVEAMVERKIADPNRLGVVGWSNGGFLTGAVITQSKRFKGASFGAGVIDQTMQWGLEDTPGHVINFMAGKLPWEDPGKYQRSSPLYHLDRVTTPTLIHVGEQDARVPAAHARTLYRGLKKYRKVDSQLIVYPGQPHSLSRFSFRKAKMEWDLAWMRKYVLGKEDAD